MQDDVCTVHSDRPAVETCSQCHQRFCEFCMGRVGGRRACTSCAVELQRRQDSVRSFAVLGLVVVGAAVAVVLVVRSGSASAPKHAVPAKTDPPAIMALKKKLAKAPCDQGLVVDLAEKLNQANRFDEVLATGKAWHKRCGTNSYLDWKLFYASKQLGRWKQALRLADGLVAGDPRDSDFWWWRGEVRARHGLTGGALADYRQSIANSDGPQAAGFAVGRIVDPAKTAHEPCDAADAIRYFVGYLGGEIALDLRDDMVSFTRQGHCLSKTRGKSRFAVGDALHPAVVRAKVGGTRGHFHVDAATGTTVISSAFAKRAGIEVGKERAETMAEGKLETGKLGATTIAIGGAHSDGVDVLVVDDVGAKVDGVIGLDFLWRFQQAEGHGRMAIMARK